MDEAQLAVIPTFNQNQFKDTVYLKFKGWHYTTPDAMPRTAFAAVASLAKEELEKTLREKSAKCILDGAENKWEQKYATLLFNQGQSVQTRAENMLLARQALVLVRGGPQGTVATPCNAEGWVMLTNAHQMALNQAIQFLISEAERSRGSTEFSASDKTVWHRIRDHTGKKLLSTLGEKLRLIKGLKELYDLQVHPELMAHLVQATANILTAYSDAGTRFRDRQARLEAIRHQTHTARAILAYESDKTEFDGLFQWKKPP